MRLLVWLVFSVTLLAQRQMFPHVTAPDGGFLSQVAISNSGCEPSQYSLIATLSDGQQQIVSGSCPAGSSQTHEMSQLFGGAEIAFLDVAGNSEIMLSYQLAAQGGSPAQVAVSSQQANSWVITPGDWSVVIDGFAVVNTGQDSVVEVRQIDQQGSTLASTSLGSLAAERKQLYLPDANLGGHFSPIAGSRFLIEADQPLALTALRFNQDRTFLWSVPALPQQQEVCPIVPSELILFNAAIYTVNAEQPWAQAMAIDQGRITYIGSEEGVTPYQGPNSQLLDAGGRLVLPGIHDVHAHPLEAGSPVGGTCLLPADTDPESMIPQLRNCAPNQLGTDWLLGFGFSIHKMFEVKRDPKEILDEAVGNRAAAMMEETSHAVWVSSAALLQAGITGETPDPPGGVIGKNPETGEPDGLLYDNAGDLVFDQALAPTAQLADLHYEGLLFGLEQLARNGITSVCDARTYWGRGYHEVWQRALAENKLTARTILGLWAYPHFEDESQLATLASLYQNSPESLLRASQIKVYMDGIIPNTTAALLQPYETDLGITGPTGLNYFTQQRLSNYIEQLEKVGFDFHIHAIGDRGVREALDAIAQVSSRNGVRDRRHRLTHLELVDPQDRPRFAQLGVLADLQVAGEFTDPAHAEDNVPFIGDRSFDTVPVRSLYDQGAHVTLSSDWDVSSLNPFVGMRRSLFRGAQSLPDLAAAVAAYTIKGAFLMRQEHVTGSLQTGKFADLIIVDRNIFEIDPQTIDQTRVLLTMLAGKTVFSRLPGESTR